MLPWRGGGPAGRAGSDLVLVLTIKAAYFYSVSSYKMKIKKLLLIAGLVFSIAFVRAQDTAPAPATDAGSFAGKVAETMTTAGYTYVLVDTGSRKLWAVAVQFAVKVGDAVTVTAGMPMPNYHSKSLNRDFDLVYFTGGIMVNGGSSGALPALPPGHPPLTGAPAPALPPGHPPLPGQAASPNLDLTGIKRAAGGKTIQEIFAAKTKLAGKPVVVRGKIVKYNAMILGKNWLHLQDGSGSAANNDNDLLVTTATTAKPGDTVLVTGNVSTDKDFGAGYKYTVILDDAKVTVE